MKPMQANSKHAAGIRKSVVQTACAKRPPSRGCRHDLKQLGKEMSDSAREAPVQHSAANPQNTWKHNPGIAINASISKAFQGKNDGGEEGIRTL
jgi:hypothetical protein